MTSTSWVTARTGAVLEAPEGLAVLGLRHNPRRAHLLVSSLLGKHVPVPAVDVLAAAGRLGALVRALVQDPFVVGFAETATALGHGVAAVTGPGGTPASYAHTTRRQVPHGVDVLAFEEEHSHAVDQALAVLDDTLLREASRPLVLVDDELSSGRTAVNAVRALQQRWPRSDYVLASLLDVRSEEQRAATTAAVAALGARLTDVSLALGSVHLPDDLLAQAAQLVDAPPQEPGDPAPLRRWTLHLPTSTPLTGAHGWDPAAEHGLRSATAALADALRPLVIGSAHVVGDEEFMYAGQLTAAALGPDVLTSTTTRSPALVVDDAGYPLRTVLRFASTDDPDRQARAYNVAAPERRDATDHLVLVTDRPPSQELVAALRGAAARSVDVVVVRAGATGCVEGPA